MIRELIVSTSKNKYELTAAYDQYNANILAVVYDTRIPRSVIMRVADILANEYGVKARYDETYWEKDAKQTQGSETVVESTSESAGQKAAD